MTTGPRTGRAVRFPRAAIATPHHLASAAGAAVLADGGNALDAILAANLALGVVAPYLCGYGGDVFAIVWDGRLHGYLGSGRSGSSASPERLRAVGHATMPTLGGPTVTVPGAVRGWFDLLERWGSRSFADLAATAHRFAAEGFPLTETGAATIAAAGSLYAGVESWSRAYGDLGAGDTLRQPGLAALIARLGDDGPDAYYRGVVADAIAAAVGGAGGDLTTADLGAHRGAWVDPLIAPFRGHEIAELPPPTQGVAALEMLRILDGFDLRSIPEDARQHLMVEAVKLGLADRQAHITDPAHMRIDPRALLEDAYIDARRAAIDPERAGVPVPGAPQLGGTAYLCAADADGLCVSLIQSNFLAFGSGVRVEDWGINLTNRGASFTLDDGAVNVLAGAKLPLHTLIPAMVLRDGSPTHLVGTMGADAQAQVHVQLLERILGAGDDPQAAIDAPRWRVEVADRPVRHETRFTSEVLSDLARRGHDLVPTTDWDMGMGHAHVIAREPGGYAVATDPRAEGAALGW